MILKKLRKYSIINTDASGKIVFIKASSQTALANAVIKTQTFMNGAEAEIYLKNNGYWTSWGLGGGTFGGSGTWLLGIESYGFQPAWDSGVITFPVFGQNRGEYNMNALKIGRAHV